VSGAACDEVRAAAPELALGMLDGEERARVLAHARGCPACRAHLDELAGVAQEILTAAPVHEPPPGFESRVLGAMLPARPPVARRGRWRLRPALAAVVVLLVAGGATWITLAQTRDERRLGAHYREVLALAGGKYLAARELRDAAGAKRGIVFLYQGDQPWVTVVLAAAASDGRWRVGLATRAGATRELGGFDPAKTGPVWGHALPVSVRELADVRLTGADGRDLRAQLRPRAPSP
jgi:hypothetical protein